MPSEAPAACLDICLDAYSHIDANANQTTLIEWWLDELTQDRSRLACSSSVIPPTA